MKDENLAKNYARPTELESVKVLELVGSIVMDSSIVGSGDPEVISPEISNIRIRTNVNLLLGSLRLHIAYHSIIGVYVADLTFMEHAGELRGILSNYSGTYIVDKYNITTATKKVGNEWQILIKPAVNEINTFTLNYTASSAEIRRPSDPEPNSYVTIENSDSYTDGTKPDSMKDWTPYTKPKDVTPPGTIVAWWPDTDTGIPNSVLTDPAKYIEENYPEWVLCDGVGPNGDGTYTSSTGATYKVPNLCGRFIMGFGSKVSVSTNMNTGGGMGDNVTVVSQPEDLGAYNDQLWRKNWNSGTEGIPINKNVVNCGKVGNKGGTYITKLLPKQQGSLVMGWRYGKGDNAKTTFAPFNAFTMAWSPIGIPANGNWGGNGTGPWDIAERFWNFENDYWTKMSPWDIFGGENMQGGINAEKVDGSEWKYGRAFLSEGAAPHENKPPYIVLAYIMKKYE